MSKSDVGGELGAYDPTNDDALSQLVHFAERTRGGAIPRVPWTVLKSAIEDLSKDFDNVAHLLQPTKTKVVRARPLLPDESCELLGDLGPAPAGKGPDIGRCHSPELRMLYAGAGVEIVLSEINAKVGDRVGLLYFEPRRPWLLITLGVLDEYRRTNGNCAIPVSIKRQIARMPSKGRDATRPFYFDAWMSDFYSRRGSADVYKLTSAFAAAALSMNPKLDGVSYESVNHEGGACVALRSTLFPQAVRPTEARIVRVSAHIGYGFYEIEDEALATTFDGERIVWR